MIYEVSSVFYTKKYLSIIFKLEILSFEYLILFIIINFNFIYFMILLKRF